MSGHRRQLDRRQQQNGRRKNLGGEATPADLFLRSFTTKDTEGTQVF
jgi:hypothetical protein